MLAIVGTVPVRGFPITHGRIVLDNSVLSVGGTEVDLERGTPALMAAAAATAGFLGAESPYGFLVGDIGHGKGSRELYQYLTEHLCEFDMGVLTFHYLQPIAHWHDRVLAAVNALGTRPRMIADAGFMYAAKMSGHARSYDLFTPDAGELAFLADESAPHPFYARGFILHDETRAEDLVDRAYAHGNAARTLLVKGRHDLVVEEGRIVRTVAEPDVGALEAIGGTGDTVTGIVSVLVSSAMPIPEAAAAAAMANRFAGLLAEATPATSVRGIVSWIPRALDGVLSRDPRKARGSHVER
jgi:NAD(P)H-hydrate repair Nnr-like enzyme with NAD(P)H-hydrate dehydratase domain